MKIQNYLLFNDDGTPVKQVVIPSGNYGGVLPNRVATILHYTAGGSPIGTIEWFSNPLSRVSAHLLITREGEVVQFVPFNRVAYHAGTFYNWHSIGIELDNYGTEKLSHPLPADKKVRLLYWKQTVTKTWEVYPDVQIARLIEVMRLLNETYGPLRTICHEDILDSKSDPGPAFPMGDVLIKTYTGIVYPAPIVPTPSLGTYKVTAYLLNVRSSPSVPAPNPNSNIIIGTLKQGAILTVYEIVGDWSKIGDSKYVWSAFLEKQS